MVSNNGVQKQELESKGHNILFMPLIDFIF